METQTFKSQNPNSKHKDANLPDLLENTPVIIKDNKSGQNFNGIFSHWDKDNDAHIMVPDLGKKVFRKHGKFEIITDRSLDQVFGGANGVRPHVAKNALLISEVPEMAKSLEPAKQFDINQRFSFLASLVKMVVKGQAVSGIITGDGGLGKTHTVMGQVHAAGLKEVGEDIDPEEMEEGDEAILDGDYVVLKGYSTAKGLYNTLYYNREKLVIFDDCDSILKDEVAVNLLKGALDSYDKRVITWNSQGFADDIPKKFEFTGRVIFISNMKRNQIPQALISRSTSVDVSMTVEEKLIRIKSVLPLIKQQSTMEVKERAFAILEKWAHHTQDLNFRTMMKIVSILESEEDQAEAEAMAEYMILS